MSSRDPPFMSPLVKHLLKRRQALLRKGGQKQNPNVTILQERINKLIRENQLQAVKHESNKHDKGTRSWWSTINSITGRKSISSITDPASINEYFGKINTDPDYSPPEMLNIPEGTRVPSFTVHEVTQALINIKRTSSGPDDLPYFTDSLFVESCRRVCRSRLCQARCPQSTRSQSVWRSSQFVHNSGSDSYGSPLVKRVMGMAPL